MKYIKTTFLIIFSLIPLSLLIANDTCPIPGKPIHWAAEYCMYKIGTDDFHNQEVMDCFHSQNYKELEPCEAKEMYKEKICKILSRYYDNSWENCFNDPNFIPESVKNNGVSP